MNAEETRLEEERNRERNWKRWGPYVSERAWGTVREDYSADGSAWEYFPFEQALYKAYRWNEDGLAGICDRRQRICFAIALWNEHDPFLKERLYGLGGNQGNHGEDVKEYYFYLDSTPTHSYMKFLYKYCHAEFPYARLLEENRNRDKSQPEFELMDTGVFDADEYFDVTVEYAKADVEDICIRITATNRGNHSAPLHILPTVWFRNRWSWTDNPQKSSLAQKSLEAEHLSAIEIEDDLRGHFTLYAEGPANLLFTENDTNFAHLYGGENKSPFTKDGINDYVVNRNHEAVNRDCKGTKAAAHYVLDLGGGQSETVYLRLVKSRESGGRSGESEISDLKFEIGKDRNAVFEDQSTKGKGEGSKVKGQRSSSEDPTSKIEDQGSNSEDPSSKIEDQKTAADGGFSSHDSFIAECEKVFELRIAEADEFYAGVIPGALSADAGNVMRQALSGMLWSKQYYHYVVKEWLDGDSAFGSPPESRLSGRNNEWKHLYNSEVISMPDKWEYPWYASWDLAFHCLTLAIIDPTFAKEQLILMLREWYMHPNGQIPAYEWKFDDVNPPVHAWAALRVYRIEKKRRGKGDRDFLEKVFHKLLLNFTWWVNRKDAEGNNVFEGGFLGLDNIGVFDRSKPLPHGGRIEQSDGTSWMAMFCLNMLAIAMELAADDKVYEDVASKFFEHFVYISDAMNNIGSKETELWNERDGFYYDVLHMDGTQMPLKVRSMVGLIPLFAVETVDEKWLERLPDFQGRMDWFLQNRPDLTDDIECLQTEGRNGRRLLALVNRERLRRVLRTMLSEAEFLSDYGIRALSRYHKNHPYQLDLDGGQYGVDYEPAESTSGLFGGNSNWRGPVWFPANYLLIEALQKFDFYFGDEFKIEFPTGSEKLMTLWDISQELSNRLANIFLKTEDGTRAVYGRIDKFQKDEHWRDLILFHEYFHGDNGTGLGASHQTGWTGLVAKLLQQLGDYKDEGSGSYTPAGE
jgi:hypothetical protein